MNITGLSFNSLAILINEHLTDLEGIVELMSDDQLELSSTDFNKIVSSLVLQAPGLAANIIAVAAGEGSAEDAIQLPMAVQIHALLQIADMTFKEVGGVKKSWEQIAALLKTTTGTKVLAKAKATRNTKAV